MKAFTRERLLKIQQWRETYGPGSNVVLPAEEAEELARIALASLEAEPVAYIIQDSDARSRGEKGILRYFANISDEDINEYEITVTPLYTAPPAPVVDAEPVAWTSEEALVEVYCGETGMIGPHYMVGNVPLYRHAQHAPVVPDEMPVHTGPREFGRPQAYVDGWNACRAAMLQGAEQPQSAQQNIPEIIPGGLIEAVNNLLNNDGSRGCYSAMECAAAREKIELWLAQRQKWESQRSQSLSAGNSPVIPDGYVVVPERLTAENGAKSALVGEFSETKFINCPECFGDGDCETCDGCGSIKISVPVSWTNIKAIWAKGVEHFAAAPKQETL